MDSDSSMDGDERRNGGGFKKWENRANSDVSDDENFSRGAKSIDSPPESPPRGGGNLDSPPASPAQGVESPHSEYFGSGASSAGGSSPQNPDSPVSPRRSPRPRSPQDDDDEDEERPCGEAAQRPDSPADIESPRSGPLLCPRTPPDSPANSSSPGGRKSPASSPGGRSHKSSSESPERRPGGSRFERLERTKNSPPSSPARPRRRPRSPEISAAAPESPISDDGRSNISSNSSLGSGKYHHRRKSPPASPPKVEIKSHGEDLSDVSDIESIGSDIDNETAEQDKNEDDDKKDKGSVSGLNPLEEAEQLDFEAEEEPKPVEESGKPEKEPINDGPTNDSSAKKANNEKDKGSGSNGDDDDEEEGEVKELEDGEITDEGENRPEETEPRPVCRFFSRGQCTWGSSCRFVHPGVTDKGNYTMFDMVRPLVTMNSGPPGPPMHMFGGPVDMYGPRPMDRPMMGPGPPFQQPVMRRDEPPGESAWERGLRQAKEMLRRSNKRKETDVDFEEKKMNLSLTGTDEYDKENDYYTRPASPIFPEEPPPPVYHERYPGPPKEPPAEKRYRSVSDRFGDYPPPQFYPPPSGREQWYDDRPQGGGRFHPHPSRHPQDYDRPRNERGRGGNSVPPEEYYDNRGSRKKYSSREVTVQRSEKSDRNWKDASPSPRPRGSDRSGNVRGDEWSDPWMRSKSPKRGRPTSRPRKTSYSSRSSYSSSSSSRSSSYSSYSRSRSRSRSSKSPSVSRSRSRSSFSRRKPSPSVPRRNKSPFSRDRRLEADRSLHMNPPAPSPRRSSPPVSRRVLTPPSDRSNRNLSAKILAAAIRDRSSSRSSSGSDSSGSSSDSSSDSGSSSSSSRARSPPSARLTSKALSSRKKIEIDEKMAIAHAMKSKAMDALKLSGQKQQIKLTLKGNTERPSQPAPASRKRVAESPPDDDSDTPSAKKKGPPASRREELLKQLKAVEDAIARKRSKT